MRNRSVLFALLFALLGGGATLYALADRSGGADADATSVLLATRAMDVGRQLTEADFTAQKVPSNTVPQDAIRDAASAAGSYAALPMVKGEVLLTSKLSSTPSGSRLATVIPDGKVAVSVAVNDVISTGGCLAPGDRVDVLGVVSKLATDSAAVVPRDIHVLAVSNRIVGADHGNGNTSKSTIRDNPRTLDTTVTLDEAARLVQVDETGTLRLALRQRHDSANSLKR